MKCKCNVIGIKLVSEHAWNRDQSVGYRGIVVVILLSGGLLETFGGALVVIGVVALGVP